MTKSAVRRRGFALKVRTYRAATGATAGSIMAVIISDHIGRNSLNGRPMVPLPLPISRATATTPAQARAATPNRAMVVGVSWYERSSASVAGSGHADQAKGAAKPLVPVPSNLMPKAFTLDLVAGVTVSVVLAGWNTLLSCTGSVRPPEW